MFPSLLPSLLCSFLNERATDVKNIGIHGHA
jgi:hypothetical protein